ncbi:glycoside hydrolase family 33 protein [Candidatus Desulfosporosinus infrequens]|uniref:Glycoside hydrolase family 33 protein n=1 Tax=Candidatus Desulfosporosinus infrequens TaxID=2043169 RepID=A0A2U3LAS8_9FIRM|nr:glycoside hydrolase family 33 protein [Candidatus Desulfosporosinus infrequens]
MKKLKFIMAIASIAVIGTTLAVHYSSGQSMQQLVQQSSTSSPSQAGSLGVIASTEPQPPPPEDIEWLPNHRIQTIRKDRVDVAYIDAKHGWKLVPGQGAMNSEPADIYQTTDGGETWIKVAVANQQNISASESTNLPAGTLPNEGIKNGLSFANSSTGWITGYAPRVGYQWIFVTNDGGHTWVHQELPVPKDVSQYTSMSFDLTPPTFFTSKDGILIEKIADAPRSRVHPTYVFFFTQDGGQNWKDQPSSNINLKFPDSDPNRLGQSFLVTLNDATWHTSDSGYTWTQ